ncbi:hypothetical protein F4821DRAFT_247704 [Hypoxylon rubiginosum]|uniref:Uncharacterized protein n=1 Tax=Hypoxylon rubiginosum TaxID=110542 RepID=A0ACC0CPA9_9PEZI|nr:hypothetical protein F4821DRAFT_247704 [Hypoxylon rubiginosum]
MRQIMVLYQRHNRLENRLALLQTKASGLAKTRRPYYVMSSNPFSSLFNQQNLTARLAILQPASDHDAPIELRLTEVTLKDTSYECLSYDRSTPEAIADVATISVDGEAQPVPKALESALRIFRRKERPRTLWADLLIGRTIEERSSQAPAQRHVLQNAERTLCWLGPDQGDKTAEAFKTIHEMSWRFSAACAKVGISPDMSITRATIQQLTGLREELNNCPYNDLNSFDFAHWRLIYDIFGSPYWGTVQCISDIVLAKTPIVACGRSNIRWHAYIAASRAMPFYQHKFFKVPLLPHVMKGFDLANQIEIAERRRRLGESVELLPMIQTARDCGAADPRENVFAMSLIATPSARTKIHSAGSQPLPAVDYAKSAQQVFTEAARYSILERQDFMLWYGDRPPCAKRTKGLPSWVPDFGAVAPKIGGLFNPNKGMRGWWDAIQPASARKPITITSLEPSSSPSTSTSTSTSTPTSPSSPSDPKLALHLQARPLDRIVHVSPIFNAGNCRRLCYTQFSSLPTAPTSETASRFWRTLILNSGGDRPASSSLHDAPAAPAELEQAFASLLAEETILQQLGCATVAELRTPENAARMQASPELMAYVPRCGRAAPYEALLTKNAAGRRFFRTAGGRFGMTAIEDVGAADSNLLGEEKADGEEDKVGLGRLMGDPMTRGMMESFQQYLAERDPQIAHAAAQAIRGEFPGQVAEGQERSDGGVQEGDLVVACVGGFFPYVLRPQSRAQSREGETGDEGESTQPVEGSSGDDGSTYEFVGECYLHGAMDGEDFQATGLLGRKYFNVDVSKLVDITII